MINRVTLLGNLGGEPDMKFTAEGIAMAQFSVATERTWKDEEGQEKKETEWHRIVTWRGLAEACNKYLKKGSRVYIEGRLHYSEWDDEEKGKQRKAEVIAEVVKFL